MLWWMGFRTRVQLPPGPLEKGGIVFYNTFFIIFLYLSPVFHASRTSAPISPSNIQDII